MSLTVGSRLGHYAVAALIGEGGMGQVYQATDTKLNRFRGRLPGRPPGLFETMIVEVDSDNGEVVSVART